MIYTLLGTSLALTISLYFNYRQVKSTAVKDRRIAMLVRNAEMKDEQIKLLSDREPVNAGRLLSEGKF